MQINSNYSMNGVSYETRHKPVSYTHLCGNYNNSHDQSGKVCCSHNIQAKVIDQLVLETIHAGIAADPATPAFERAHILL